MEYNISEINKDVAVDFVQKYHYSKILPRLTKHYLGVFDGDRMIGAITLGWGTQPLQTIKKLFPEQGYVTNDYIEIGKMCFSPEVNNNSFSGSKIMSLLVKWLKRNTAYSFLYTLADGIMGKCGYVYQASNFNCSPWVRGLTDNVKDLQEAIDLFPVSTGINRNMLNKKSALLAVPREYGD